MEGRKEMIFIKQLSIWGKIRFYLISVVKETIYIAFKLIFERTDLLSNNERIM